MVNQQATTNHREIRAWADRHGLQPVEVLPLRVDSEPAMLAFARASEIRLQLQLLAWDQFLALLDVQNLALVYDAGTDREPPTDFYELVNNHPSSTLGQANLQA